MKQNKINSNNITLIDYYRLCTQITNIYLLRFTNEMEWKINIIDFSFFWDIVSAYFCNIFKTVILINFKITR